MPLVLDALSEMASHKLRTLLTLLGMIFGVGAVQLVNKHSCKIIKLITRGLKPY